MRDCPWVIYTPPAKKQERAFLFRLVFTENNRSAAEILAAAANLLVKVSAA
jgi:hypothetical protein